MTWKDRVKYRAIQGEEWGGGGGLMHAMSFYKIKITGKLHWLVAEAVKVQIEIYQSKHTYHFVFFL